MTWESSLENHLFYIIHRAFECPSVKFPQGWGVIHFLNNFFIIIIILCQLSVVTLLTWLQFWKDQMRTVQISTTDHAGNHSFRKLWVHYLLSFSIIFLKALFRPSCLCSSQGMAYGERSTESCDCLWTVLTTGSNSFSGEEGKEWKAKRCGACLFGTSREGLRRFGSIESSPYCGGLSW